MKNSARSLLTAGILLAAAPLATSQSSGQSKPAQHEQDVPKQKPGTNNPDLGAQHQPAPPSPKPDAPQEGDVPKQEAGPNNPDVAKQRQSKPKSAKKNKHRKSTATSTTNDR